MDKITGKKLEEFLKENGCGTLVWERIQTVFDIKLKTPVLDCDKWMEERGVPMLQRSKNERSAVFALLNTLFENGFYVSKVDDGGDEDILIKQDATAKDVMEEMFGVDDCIIWAGKEAHSQHYIRFVFGNADDASEVVADWSYSVGDDDGFSALMDAFSPEDHI